MNVQELPIEFGKFGASAVAAIRRAYDINVERFDPTIGDDAVVFGFGIYRNSWYLIEQEIASIQDWKSARPLGSLVVKGHGLRIHVYRHGHNGDVDLDTFRLDDAAASATQRSIVEHNSLQLKFPGLDDSEESPDLQLTELVIVHAGNPDDGCCGIWLGAPIPSTDVHRSPWYWVSPLWLADVSEPGRSRADRALTSPPRHSELAEPVLNIEPIHADELGNA